MNECRLKQESCYDMSLFSLGSPPQRTVRLLFRDRLVGECEQPRNSSCSTTPHSLRDRPSAHSARTDQQSA